MLAIANPFCCCFGKDIGSDSHKDSQTTQVNFSCCHSASTDLKKSDPSDQSPRFPHSCPCKKPQVQSSNDDLNIPLTLDTLGKQSSDLETGTEYPLLSVSRLYSETLNSWRPPPPEDPLHLLNCVFII